MLGPPPRAATSRSCFATGLHQHPLLTIDALLELSNRLDATQFLYNLGTLGRFTDRRDVASNGLSPQETIRTIRDNRSWIVLKHVQTDPEYGTLVNKVLDEVQERFGREMAGMHQRECYVFVTSPGAVTPLHMDPEHNILFQIRGWKSFHLWDPSDQHWLPDEFLERFYTADNHKEVQLSPIGADPTTFRLDPGHALHSPLEAPHWVQNGDEVSISFSTTWRTKHSRRKSSIHQCNARLRRWGLQPAPYGRRPNADRLKYGAMRVGRRMKRFARG